MLSMNELTPCTATLHEGTMYPLLTLEEAKEEGTFSNLTEHKCQNKD